MASRTSNFGALGVSALATVVALGVAEAALRWLLPAPPLVDLGTRHGADVSVSASPTDSRRISDLYLQTDKGLRLRPNASLKIARYPVGGRTVEISSDELGMRRIVRTAAPDDAATRVLFLGDSVTFGEGVSDDETFAQRLEGRRLPDGRLLSTFNGGIPGYGLANEVELLADLAASCATDVNVLVFYLNDAIPSPSIRVYSPPSLLSRSYLVSQVYVAFSRIAGRIEAADRFMPEAGLVERWQREVIEDKANPSRVLAAENLADWGVAWSDGVWPYLAPLLQRFAGMSQALGARPVIVITPLRDQLDPARLDDRPQRQVTEIGRRLGIPVIDLLPPLRADGRGAHELFLDHCHYTPQGHELVADILARELGRLPGGGAPGDGSASAD